MHSIHSFVRWFCSQLTRDELIEALTLLLEVFDGSREDIQLKSQFREQHPNYRKFCVDTTPPLTESAESQEKIRTADWRDLLAKHERRTGRVLVPVRRHQGAQTPPSDCCCEHCRAPASWLSVNDGLKNSQVRCKVCHGLSPVRRVRRQAAAQYWCPHCGKALYRWKQLDDQTIFKCGNNHCPHYLQKWQALNCFERLLARTGASSQFKLRYQWRQYHFDPSSISPHPPCTSAPSLLNIRRNLEAAGLALAYSVSLGLSARLTAQVLRDIHGIPVSHQTVLNWMEAAAVPAWNRLQHRLKGTMCELAAAADETYIKIQGTWCFTWFVIGVETRAIWAWEVSTDRDHRPAIAVLNHTLENRPDHLAGTLVLVGDGNPAYDAATNAINTDQHGIPLPADQRKIERRTVTGLTNDDLQSEQFRPFKEVIERLNRTYRFHTRSRSGHKSLNGARALTTLFVAHYNFLRPHRALGNRPPIRVAELDKIQTLQGRWLKLLQLTA